MDVERECAITDIMIALRQADYECTSDECEKVLGVFMAEGCELTNEHIIAAFEDLNLE